ncbi:MAG: helix-turn-helix domain-containing protein [Candidatus Diapherotrites archaeon]
MFSAVLEEIGLSPNEAKVYEALVNAGTCSINTLSIEANVHRRNVYDSIDKLIKKGLATEEFVSGTRFVRAVNPSRLLDIVREKESKVESIIAPLQKRFEQKARGEEAVIYRGIEGFKNYLDDILEENQPVSFIGAKGFWLDERLKFFLPKFDRQRVKQGIHFRHIFDHEVKRLAPNILKMKLNEYKFFPPECSSSVAIDVFGDHVVTFYGVSPGKLPEEPVQFMVVSKKIADGYRKYFEFMWNSLKAPK